MRRASKTSVFAFLQNGVQHPFEHPRRVLGPPNRHPRSSSVCPLSRTSNTPLASPSGLIGAALRARRPGRGAGTRRRRTPRPLARARGVHREPRSNLLRGGRLFLARLRLDDRVRALRLRLEGCDPEREAALRGESVVDDGLRLGERGARGGDVFRRRLDVDARRRRVARRASSRRPRRGDRVVALVEERGRGGRLGEGGGGMDGDETGGEDGMGSRARRRRTNATGGADRATRVPSSSSRRGRRWPSPRS